MRQSELLKEICGIKRDYDLCVIRKTHWTTRDLPKTDRDALIKRLDTKATKLSNYLDTLRKYVRV